jgi:hypothetical protein
VSGTVNGSAHPPVAGAAPISPVVGIVATPDGQGYWLVAADGGVFTLVDGRNRWGLGLRLVTERPAV